MRHLTRVCTAALMSRVHQRQAEANMALVKWPRVCSDDLTMAHSSLVATA